MIYLKLFFQLLLIFCCAVILQLATAQFQYHYQITVLQIDDHPASMELGFPFSYYSEFVSGSRYHGANPLHFIENTLIYASVIAFLYFGSKYMRSIYQKKD